MSKTHFGMISRDATMPPLWVRCKRVRKQNEMFPGAQIPTGYFACQSPLFFIQYTIL